MAWLEQVASRDAETVSLLKRFFVESSGLRDRVAYEDGTLRAQVEAGGLDIDADLPRTVRPRRR